jgi:hypothetical protein
MNRICNGDCAICDEPLLVTAAIILALAIGLVATIVIRMSHG